MKSRLLTLASLLFCALAPGVFAAPTELAAAPPMGWNSWDAYGLTINEADFKANAQVLAGLKEFGWNYAVIDEGWYMGNPFVEHVSARDYQMDAHGLLIPAVSRFPSAADGRGFKPLADWTHTQGLKFGIHIVRGIPKTAVGSNRPIAQTHSRATDAADSSDTCPWDDGNYGVRDNAAGQAYYDSMLRQYADWGVDFIKVDCIADHPYKPAEIRQIRTAIEHSGRPMVLSLSPGPTQLAHAEEIGQSAQLWRISNDIWDGWSFVYKNPKEDFPAGVVTAFDNLARWSRFAKSGNWPDADMLPFGSLTPHPGWGEPRQSRLSAEEQRTQFLLWCIARSPLILGANLTHLDAATRALITNRDIISLNQTALSSRPVAALALQYAKARAWVAELPNGAMALGLFNLADKPMTFTLDWQRLGLTVPVRAARSLTEPHQPSLGNGAQVSIPAHGSVAYRIN